MPKRGGRSQPGLLATAGLVLSSFALVLALKPERIVDGSDYPSDTVRMIVPYTAGSGTDNASRLMAEQVSKVTDRPFVIVNRPGGGTIIGTREIARARPDGYTLGIIDPAFAINSSLHDSLPYDTGADFIPVSLLTTNPLVLTVPASVPAQNLEQFLDYARERGGELSYASPGYGSAGHLVFEQFLRASGLKMVHIPYQGSGAALKDVLAGRVSAMFLSENTVLPHIRAGTLRALAATGPEGATLLPEIPAFHETGLPDVSLQTFSGLIAPAGTPEAVVETLQESFAEALAAPQTRARFDRLGLVPVASRPDEFSAFLAAQRKEIGDLLRAIRASQKGTG